MRISREAKIGIIAVLCFAALYWGINFLKGRDVFSRSNTFYAVFTHVDGLVPTNHVQISGFTVGTVRDIEFEQGHTGRLIVTLQVQRRYRIPQGTVAKLISADIMGGKAIKLEVSPSTTFHQSGDTLIAQIETGLMDQLMHQMDPMRVKAEALMQGMSQTLEAISLTLNAENRAHVSSSLAALSQSLGHLQSTTQRIDQLLQEENGALAQIIHNIHAVSSNLQASNQEVTAILRNLSAISDSMAQANLASTLRQTDSAVHALHAIAARINAGQGTLGLLVTNDTLYHNLQSASRHLDSLIQDLQRNPRRYLGVSIFGRRE